MKISVVMIVRNEECCLEECLKSLIGFHELIICDTGSSDKTIEIAKRYGAQILEYQWHDDFSAARNYAKSHATGDWVFSMDADHVLESKIKISDEAIKAEKQGAQCAFVRAGNSHWMPVLFKNLPETKWLGMCHEVINTPCTYKSSLVMRIGRSKTHDTDPSRNLRILLKDERTPRNKFYIGRTLYEMRDYQSAIHWLEEYLAVATWLPEKAEAYYALSKCHWYLSQGELARDYCLKAISINANMRKAALLMADMSWKKNADTWRAFAKHCTNEDVLFI